MPEPSAIPAQTIAAYQSAIYEVDWIAIDVMSSSQRRQLVLNQPSALLEDILNMTGCRSFAFVTAYNPEGAVLQPCENEALQTQLFSEVSLLGYQQLTGRGRDAAEAWTPEESVLIHFGYLDGFPSGEPPCPSSIS